MRHYIVCSNALIMDLNQIVSEHEPIVQAIIAGNAEAAETLARDHNAPEVERAAAAMVREQAGTRRNAAGKAEGEITRAAIQGRVTTKIKKTAQQLQQGGWHDIQLIGKALNRRAVLAGGAAALSMPFIIKSSYADAKPFRISLPGNEEEWQAKNLQAFKAALDKSSPGQFDVQIHYNGTLFGHAPGFSDSNDSPANTLFAVKVSTLPAAGSLWDNGVAGTAGQFISIGDVNAGLLPLCWATNANGTTYANFTFQVQDNGGTANGGVDLDPSPDAFTINVTSVNDAPSWSLRRW